MEYIIGLYDVPTAPAIKGVTPGNGQLLVYFYPPILDGGTPITGYEYSLDGSSFIFVRNTVSPMTIRGLTNGQLYSVVIRAVNIVGHGPPSEPVEGTPVTAPSAPIITGITHGDSQLIVTFIAPFNGGSPIIDYQYSVNNGSIFTSAGTTVSPITIDGLTNGQSYQVVIRAVNSVGSGYPSNMMTGVPSTVPSAPIITAIIPSNEQLTVYFTLPSDGGSPVTNYRYSTTEPYQWIDAGLNNPITITGLTNGQPYPIRIQAVNINGEGTSGPEEGTPATVPGAPHITGIISGNGQLTVDFITPSLTGGSPIIGYQYSTNGGTFSAPVPAPENQILITGLTNGQLYQIVIQAVNIIGAGISSNMESGTPATTPSAPRITRVIPGDAQLTVYFVPSFNGGSPITGYQYSTNNGVTFLHTVEPINNVIIITGLTNGTVYQVIIRAVNNVGDGANSNMVTKYPVTVPGAPNILEIYPQSGSVGDINLLVFYTPPSDGGTPILDYQYSLDGGSFTSAGLNNPMTISGLALNQTYQIMIRASNFVGAGAPSNIVPGTTTAVAPFPPTIIDITPGNQQLTVAFDPPITDGGLPVTSYEYSLNGIDGTFIPVATIVSPIIISGLTNGQQYQVVLRAANAIGYGNPSNTVEATPATAPSAPTITGITPGDQQLIVAFIPPSDGGSPIIEYGYSTDNGINYTYVNTTVSPITIMFTSSNGLPLTNGTTYQIIIKAVNMINGNIVIGAPSNMLMGIPGTPTAPTITGITPGESSLIVAFSAPSYGSPFTGYQYSINGLPFSLSVTPVNNQITITGLTNGQLYSVRIRAVNLFGAGVPSLPVSATPGIVPDAPTITVTPGNTLLTVTVTSSALNITGYRYSINGGALVPPLTDPPINQNPFTITGLTNGISYSVVVHAVNISGTGPGSAPVSRTPGTVPGAPTDVIVTPGNGSLSVAFTAPSTGGSPITDYQCTATPTIGSPVIKTGTASPINITGLTNGISYSIVVRAVNSFGTGPGSVPVSKTPGTVPDAPILLGILSGNGQLSVGFCPVPDGGAPITSYEYTATPTTGLPVSGQSGVTTSPVVVPGLTNGTLYSVVIRAVNIIGTSALSNSLSGTPGTASAPRISGITPGIGQLSVAFIPSTSTGGFPIIRYQCTATSGGSSVIQSGTTSPIIITGLSNITYHVQMLAVNSTGNGAISNMVEGTPVTVPGVPTITSITPGNGTLSVAFTTPSSGGSPILYYQYSLSLPPSNWVNAGSTTPIQITGLSNGTFYHVTIRAVNVYGDGAISNTVEGTPSTTPSAPTITGIDPNTNGKLIVHFTAPTSIPITGYKYSTDNGSTFPVEVIGNVSSINIPASYNVTNQVIIRAFNSSGDGAISNMVEAISGAPSAPTIIDVIPGDTFLTIEFTKPVYDGFAPIAQYQYSVDGGSYSTISPPEPLKIFLIGLTNGISYSVVIRAVSYVAVGVLSNTVIGIPGTPTAPYITSVISGNGQLSVTFTQSSSDGGIPPITGYQYSIDNGVTFPYSATTTTFTISGLTNGRTYQIIIRATNRIGPGIPSTMLPGTPVGVPSQPNITSIVPGNGQLFVYFTPGSDGGSPITDYQYTTGYGTFSNFRSAQTITSPIVIITTSDNTPLINGTLYNVAIFAMNINLTGEISNVVEAIPGVPTAPTVTGITPGNGILSVAFTPPSSDGGFLITGYKCTALSSGNPGILQSGGTTSPFVITGLTNGTNYTNIIIAAFNSIGDGIYSSPPASGTPIGPLPAPSITGITPGNQQLSVAFTPPSSGGSAITGYQYSTDNGITFSPTGGTTSPIIIITTSTNGAQLINGTTYPVVIRAISQFGPGASSTTVNGTPSSVPSAPLISGIVAGNQQLIVTYCPPISNGGSAITSYQYSVNNGGSFALAGASPFTILGLSNGTTYQVVMYAVNSSGDGDYSIPASETPNV